MNAQVRSFDVFDTLIARKAVSPHAVFALVEARCDAPGFAAQRVAAAFAFGGAPHGLDDIYAELGRRHGYPAERLAALKAAELEVEFEQLVPIAENLRQVNDGDLLITDMYLPDAMIFELLARAGLKRNVHLIRSAHGKASGEVWRGLAAGGVQAHHLGDNPHSDGAAARAAGHHARLTRAAGLSEVEDYLFRQGYTGSALLARALRLSAHNDDPTAEQLRLLQGQVNAPMLIVASLHLAGLLAGPLAGVERLAFCSRDCTAWLKVFRALQPVVGGRPLAGDYFYTSRLARKTASADYVAYARGALTPSTLLVDLCGSGLSVQSFLDRHAIASPALYLFKATSPAVLARVAPLYGAAGADRVRALIDNRHLADATPTAGELMNLVDHGMALDARRVFGGFLPVLAEPEFPPRQVGLIRVMREEAERAATAIADPAFGEHFALRDALVPPERAAETLAALWALAARSQPLHAHFEPSHLAEDQKVHERLLAPAAVAGAA